MNFTVKEFLYDIPTIVTATFNCTENCEPSSESGWVKGFWEKGITNSHINKGFELFSKTKTGQFFLNQFMDKGETFYSFKALKQGKFFNKHSIMFVDSTQNLYNKVCSYKIFV